LNAVSPLFKGKIGLEELRKNWTRKSARTGVGEVRQIEIEFAAVKNT